ncbi:MAG: (2Fe-2S)-binding protein [Flavobacteriaceae bacterium]
MKLSFTINNEPVRLEVDGDTPLLWVLRDVLNLKGTKFGCGKAACGACTVIVDGEAVRCCSFPAQLAQGTVIRTIEGLQQDGDLHPVQQAWTDEVVPQCGYCQPGFMMATVAMLDKIPEPSDEDIDNRIDNICRCGTYYRMRKAIHRAVTINKESTELTTTSQSDE